VKDNADEKIVGAMEKNTGQEYRRYEKYRGVTGCIE
jgi:hypothetical protein